MIDGNPARWPARLFGAAAVLATAALIAGLPTTFEEPRQQVVYELTIALIAPRRNPDPA